MCRMWRISHALASVCLLYWSAASGPARVAGQYVKPEHVRKGTFSHRSRRLPPFRSKFPGARGAIHDSSFAAFAAWARFMKTRPNCDATYRNDPLLEHLRTSASVGSLVFTLDVSYKYDWRLGHESAVLVLQTGFNGSAPPFVAAPPYVLPSRSSPITRPCGARSGPNLSENDFLSRTDSDSRSSATIGGGSI
ncbi:hypothetical protein BC827DRAFT_350295 [Russula dissimulans]|nr:hypothetical protein BC827DRAFT_350295 [Russula dissimulans]